MHSAEILEPSALCDHTCVFLSKRCANHNIIFSAQRGFFLLIFGTLLINISCRAGRSGGGWSEIGSTGRFL